MKTSSAKAKGRRLQQFIRDSLRVLYQFVNPLIEEEDIESRPMGCNGEDIILSPAAKRICNIKAEIKNVESLNVCTTFWDHFRKYKDAGALVVLIHAKNRTEATVTMRWQDFLPYLHARIVTPVETLLPFSLLQRDGSVRGAEAPVDTADCG